MVLTITSIAPWLFIAWKVTVAAAAVFLHTEGKPEEIGGVNSPAIFLQNFTTVALRKVTVVCY